MLYILAFLIRHLLNHLGALLEPREGKLLWFFQDSYSVLTRGLAEGFLKAAAARVASGQPESRSRPLERD